MIKNVQIGKYDDSKSSRSSDKSRVLCRYESTWMSRRRHSETFRWWLLMIVHLDAGMYDGEKTTGRVACERTVILPDLTSTLPRKVYGMCGV